MKVTMYHNPRCSKSRAALKLLREGGIEPEIIEYLQTPPSAGQVDRILNMLGVEPRRIMRRKENAYAALGLDNENLTRQELIQAIVTHPILLERPIVVANGKAALGRPPEEVLTIL